MKEPLCANPYDCAHGSTSRPEPLYGVASQSSLKPLQYGTSNALVDHQWRCLESPQSNIVGSHPSHLAIHFPWCEISPSLGLLLASLWERLQLHEKAQHLHKTFFHISTLQHKNKIEN